MNKDHILDTIILQIREVIPALAQRPLDASDSLKALGANSVDRADIIMMTLESLSVQIPLFEMAKAENIGDIASIIHARL